MKTHGIVKIIVSIIFCFLLCSCKGSSQEPASNRELIDEEAMDKNIITEGGLKNERPHITLTLGHNKSGLPQSRIVQRQALDFEKETGIHIEFDAVEDALWRDLLKTKLSDGSAPDMFVVDSDPFSLYDRIRPDINCIDLTKEEFIGRMDESVLSAISYNNATYGITFIGKKIWVYSYRKDVFEDLNLSIPTTYEELKNVCKVIKESGLTPMWQATSSGWHQVLPLFENGPLYAENVDNLYQKLNNNEYSIREMTDLLKVIQQINEFATLGYYGENYLSNNMEDEMEGFVSKDYVMILESIGWPNQLLTEYPEMEGKIGIFLMPWADNQIIGLNPASNALFGNKASQYPEEILEFFRFLARPEQLQKRLDGDTNALEVCWPEIEPKYPSEFTNYLNQFEKGLVMQAGVSYIDAQWMDVGRDIEKMYAGLMTPEEVLEQIYQRREMLARLSDDPNWK